MSESLFSHSHLYESLYRALQHMPKKDDRLMRSEKIVQCTKAVLAKFGLPLTQRNIELVENVLLRRSPAQKKYKLLESVLRRHAIEYLSSPALTDRQLLQHAKDRKQSAFDTLPLMNVPVCPYAVFLFDVKWMTQHWPIEDVLGEMDRCRSLTEQSEICGQTTCIDDHEELRLKKQGFTFLEEFLAYHSPR